MTTNLTSTPTTSLTNTALAPVVLPFQVGITDEEIAEFTALAARVLRSGRLILGEQTEAFEAEFAAVAGVRHAVAVATGTVALEILHRATGAAGRTALVPANTNYATAAAPQHAGARVRLYDAGLHARVDAVVDALDQHPEAHSVTVVHTGGYVSPEFDRIRAACAERDVRLFEDAAHAHGASYRGRPAGSLADAAAFSFYPTKVLTSGEGGMIATDDPRLAAAARTYRDQGKDTSGEQPVLADTAGLAGGRRYPRADEFADRHLCLPLWRAITDQDVARTLAALGVADAADLTR